MKLTISNESIAVSTSTASTILKNSGDSSISVEDATKNSLSGQDITNAYVAEFQQKMMEQSQNTINDQSTTFKLSQIGYTGKPIAELTQSEASDLVSENGFFGIAQTSERLANFVVNGAGDDMSKLLAGREGMLRGFAQAEQMWGEKLPEISYTTMQKALEKVDARIAELGGSVLDTTA